MRPHIRHESNLSRRHWLASVAGAWVLQARPIRALAEEPPLGGRIYIAVLAREGGGTFAIDPDEDGLNRVSPAADHLARVSPDGRWLCYDGSRIGAPGQWVADLRGNDEPTRVFDEGGDAHWSADSKQIALCVQRDPRSNLRVDTWTMNHDGSDTALLPIAETEYVFDWSPDGKWLLAFSARPPDGGGEASSNIFQRPVYLVRADGTGDRLLIPGVPPAQGVKPRDQPITQPPRFSPRGDQVCYAERAADQTTSIWVCDLDGKHRKRVLQGGADEKLGRGVWSPDGKWLAVLRVSPLKPLTISIVDLDGKERRRLAEQLPSFHLLDWRKPAGD